MLEVTRELVRRFNQTYAPVLVEPEILLPEIACCRRLPGTDGKEKMSKSLGNCIYMSDDEKTVWKKVKKMSNGEPRMSMEEPGHLEGNAVFTYLEAFSTPEDFAEFWPEFKTLDELKEQYVKGGIGDGTCKNFLNTLVLIRSTADNGNHLVGDGGPADDGLDLLNGDLLAFQVLHGHVHQS